VVSKDAMRQAMPTVAAIVDEFRDLMVGGGKVIYASENGKVIDRREPENAFDIPPDYYPCRPMPQPKARS
jgi:N-acetylmuramic acid 6-phosphate (MurNAc-6-P) etherase